MARKAGSAKKAQAAKATKARAAANGKISYEQFRAKLMDPKVPDREIAEYLRAQPAEGRPFEPVIEPDPKRVEMPAEARFEVESAMNWANGVARWRRRFTFSQRIHVEKLPILISEGDSWFQFPFLLEDVIDHLNPHYLISSLDEAGDTAYNMVYGEMEYLRELRTLKKNGVKAILFSGAGNDVIGEDDSGNPVLATLLKTFDAGQSAAWHIDQGKLSEVLLFLETAYKDFVVQIRAEPNGAKLPILIHGYDYVVPGGYPGDKRNPIWASQDKWLGSAFQAKGIANVAMQREIIRILIDGLYDMLARIAGDPKATHVHLVNLRGTLGLNDWADEIHPTDTGFGKVATKFRSALQAIGVG